MLTIRKGSVLCQAMVDEIVLRGEGADLARIGGGTLTVLRQTRGNDSRVERYEISNGKKVRRVRCRAGTWCQMKTH